MVIQIALLLILVLFSLFIVSDVKTFNLSLLKKTKPSFVKHQFIDSLTSFNSGHVSDNLKNEVIQSEHLTETPLTFTPSIPPECNHPTATLSSDPLIESDSSTFTPSIPPECNHPIATLSSDSLTESDSSTFTPSSDTQMRVCSELLTKTCLESTSSTVPSLSESPSNAPVFEISNANEPMASFTVKQLRDIANSKGIKSSKMNKKQLLKVLS